MSKTAIVIFSDPKAGTEEALSRIINGLAAAYDFKEAGEEVKIIFQGTRYKVARVTSKERPHAAYALQSSRR